MLFKQHSSLLLLMFPNSGGICMRLIFVRHGEPNYVKDCLTDLGLLQAKAAAERLREEQIEKIYSSPYGRAKQTADETSAVLGLDIHILDFMHELDWGSIDGTKTYAGGHPWNIADQLVREGWDLTSPDWRNHPYFRNNLVVENVNLVEAKIDGWLASLGYQRENLYYRCTRTDREQHTAVLFSHGGSSAAAIGHILNLPFPYLCAMMHLDFTGITILRLDRNPGSLSIPCLELVNDSRHIRGITL